MLLLLFINFTFAGLVPQIIPLNIYQKDVQDITLSDNGLFVCVVTYGGDAKLLYQNGQVIETFHRREDIGEYMITCTFSPQSTFIVLNSALDGNNFYGSGYIRVYDINYNTIVLTEQTMMRKWGEFPWPNAYAFSQYDCNFAFVNYGSGDIAFYDFCENQKKSFSANCNQITTMLFSQDDKFLIWKEDKTGNITLFDWSQNHVYKILRINDDAVDVWFYKNPSVLIDKDNRYLVDGSSNNGGLYMIDIQNDNHTSVRDPWMGQKMAFYEDVFLYVSIFDGQIVSKNMTSGITTKFAKATNFKLIDGSIIVTNDKEIMVCKLFDFDNCSKGLWNNKLTQIGESHTLDIDNNLILWKTQ